MSGTSSACFMGRWPVEALARPGEDAEGAAVPIMDDEDADRNVAGEEFNPPTHRR